MAGLKPNRAIVRIVEGQECERVHRSLTLAQADRIIEIISMQIVIEDMHKEVSDKVTKRRKMEIESQNRATKIINQNFAVGDFMMVCTPTKEKHELTFKCSGTCRFITATIPLVYIIVQVVQISRSKPIASV